MSSIQFRFLGQKPTIRFGNNPERPTAPTSPTQAQPTPEQIQIWKIKVRNSNKIDPYIKFQMEGNPFPIPMLARLQPPNSSEEMRQQEIALTESGVRQFSRIGNIIALQAPTLESLAKLTEIPFIISTEASR